MKNLMLLLIVFALFVFNATLLYSQVTDIDGNQYKIVRIGNQEWMSENLNVTHYRNGDPIPQVQDPEEWMSVTTGAWCYYGNSEENGKTYGKLYNWYAVNDPRGLAPEGWHIPTEKEWKQLEETLGGYLIAGGKMKSISLWENPNYGATNESGFNALPGGFRGSFGKFHNIGRFNYFWSSSEDNVNFAWATSLKYGSSAVIHTTDEKTYGFYIRCVMSE